MNKFRYYRTDEHSSLAVKGSLFTSDFETLKMDERATI